MSDYSLKKQEDVANIPQMDPLLNIELSEQKRNELLLETFGEAIISKIPIVGAITDYAQNYQSKIDSARITILLSKFNDQLGSVEVFRNKLTKLLTTNAGLVLFNKTMRIVNAGNFEQEYIELLATALKHVTDSDFEDMFNEHDYVLSQIEKLSPQALILLSDYKSWQRVSLEGGTTMSGQTLIGDWDIQVTNFYSRLKGMSDERKKVRIAHAFRELENNRYIFLTENKNLSLSPIGTEVYKYIS